MATQDNDPTPQTTGTELVVREESGSWLASYRDFFSPRELASLLFLLWLYETGRLKS